MSVEITSMEILSVLEASHASLAQVIGGEYGIYNAISYVHMI